MQSKRAMWERILDPIKEGDPVKFRPPSIRYHRRGKIKTYVYGILLSLDQHGKGLVVVTRGWREGDVLRVNLRELEKWHPRKM